MDEELDAVFGALADPTRRAILHRLKAGEASVAALAEPFAMSQPAVSKHLRVLAEAGLITRSRRGTARLSHLDAAPLRAAAAWLAEYRSFWAESHGRLDALLATLHRPTDEDRPPDEKE
ncbi:transcriptional regulator [Pilimelia anulata]|uniref:Transcriptional regulator n=1 Tax=Pilimelia anulata TaxID=53371 RepID=A0A8J3B7K3_9ACTN|nr:metalloregulator ArsR/SmtB family transcription factor [Pilimelia anulata]GGJ82051.1 transcriptional regulator [Pilimelia anulata]